MTCHQHTLVLILKVLMIPQDTNYTILILVITLKYAPVQLDLVQFVNKMEQEPFIVVEYWIQVFGQKLVMEEGFRSITLEVKKVERQPFITNATQAPLEGLVKPRLMIKRKTIESILQPSTLVPSPRVTTANTRSPTQETVITFPGLTQDKIGKVLSITQDTNIITSVLVTIL